MTNVTKTATAGTGYLQPGLDWADALALDICADMAGRQHTEARSLIAARLRRVKAEGFVAGRWPSDEAAS